MMPLQNGLTILTPLNHTIDEHNHRNLFDSSNNRRGAFIILKRHAHQTKDTQRDQITEHKVIKMGRKTLS